jgi:hypothetical protein
VASRHCCLAIGLVRGEDLCLPHGGCPLARTATGEHGWFRVANFIVVGALHILCAAAIGCILASGRGATWGHA